jgi:hypothetical protein
LVGKNNGEKFTLDYRETAPKKQAAICTSIKTVKPIRIFPKTED